MLDQEGSAVKLRKKQVVTEGTSESKVHLYAREGKAVTRRPSALPLIDVQSRQIKLSPTHTTPTEKFVPATSKPQSIEQVGPMSTTGALLRELRNTTNETGESIDVSTLQLHNSAWFGDFIDKSQSKLR